MARPASGIATIDPPPSASRIRPSAASSTPRLALANGTMGAQLEVAVPQIRKMALVARRALRALNADLCRHGVRAASLEMDRVAAHVGGLQADHLPPFVIAEVGHRPGFCDPRIPD